MNRILKFLQFNQIKESSKFIDQEEFDAILDKINKDGMKSLTDLEKKKLDIFSKSDAPIYELIDKMADITLKFKDVNQRMDELTDSGNTDEAYKVFKNEWEVLNKEMALIEKEIESYGINLGDETFEIILKKYRPDAYGYDPNRENGLGEIEI